MTTTTEHLAGLNYEQLKFAREKINVLLSQIEHETEIAVWCIDSNLVTLAMFALDDYASATRKLAEIALDSSDKLKSGDNHPLTKYPLSQLIGSHDLKRLEIHLVVKLVSQSVFDAWLNQNKPIESSPN